MTQDINVHDLDTHPAAEVFPMLPPDELHQLADDIKENGQQEPIILAYVADDETGEALLMLIDGRNRLAACTLAGADPRYEIREIDDPRSIIISLNINRRHMNKGQQAMAVAVMYPEKQQGKKIDLATKLGSSSEYLRKARTVLEFTPAAADLVLSGGSSLNDAYQEALNEKIDKARAGEDIEHLQREAPDLAALVAEERLKLSEALTALRTRKQEERNNRISKTELLKSLYQATERLSAQPANVLEALSGFVDEIEKDTGHTIKDILKMTEKVGEIRGILKTLSGENK